MKMWQMTWKGNKNGTCSGGNVFQIKLNKKKTEDEVNKSTA